MAGGEKHTQLHVAATVPQADSSCTKALHKKLAATTNCLLSARLLQRRVIPDSLMLILYQHKKQLKEAETLY